MNRVQPGLNIGNASMWMLLVLSFLAIVIALIVIPTLIANDNTGFISAAAEVGYSTPVAYWTLLVWAVVVCLTFGRQPLLQRLKHPANPIVPESNAPVINSGWQPGRLIGWEIIAVLLVFSMAYFPPFLAGYGPYVEDSYFLVALQRMDCGQLPYTDFGFLYGPLMIYPLWGWTQLFGTSLTTYFSFISLIEGIQFAALMATLQYFVPDRKQRYWIFLLLLPFLLNTLLGLNYNGLRRLLPVFVILALALRPYHWKTLIGGAVVLGLTMGYSHEYGIAALLAIVGMYGVAFLGGHVMPAIRFALAAVVLTLSVWLLTLLLLLGETMPDYFTFMAEVMGMMSKGHAGFEFYWTANSLALFGLLTVALAALGRGLFRGRTDDYLAGDRLLVAATVYALVLIKSGLTRADLWHLSAGFIALFFALLFSLPSKICSISGWQRKTGAGLIAIASATYLIGIMPTGSLYAMSYVQGALDTLRGNSNNIDIPSRTTNFELQRTQPRQKFIELSRYLADPAQVDKPVLFYGPAWPMALHAGVCSRDYKLDDLMYSEFRRPESVFLHNNPDALIVMNAEVYANLFGPRDPNQPGSQMEMTAAKKVGRLLSTVHYDMASVEGRLLREARWQLTGQYLPATHEFAQQFDDIVVLKPKLTGK